MVLGNRASKYYILFIPVIGAGLLGLLLLRSKGNGNAVLQNALVRIPITISDTESKRNQGLSGTASLAEGTGMLFVFDRPGSYGFWMKDMEYGLDFIWLNDNLQIVDITRSVMPNTYPKIFYPSEPVHYMLEVNAGFSTAHALEVGQSFELVRK